MQSRKEDTIIDLGDLGTSTKEEASLLLQDDPLYGAEALQQQPADVTVDVSPAANGDAVEDDPLAADDAAVSLGSKLLAGLRHLSIYIVSAIAASPTAISALVGPSGQGPEKIGAEWWNNMSAFRQALCILCGFSSEAVNTIMNALFIPVAWQKIRDSLADIGMPAQATKSIIAILLAVGGGIAAGALSYSSFLWLPYAALTILPTAVAFGITFAGRFISIKNIFNRISNLLNADVQLQKQFADKLTHLNSEHTEGMETHLRNVIRDSLPNKNTDEPLTEEEYQIVIRELAAKLDELDRNYDNVINDTTKIELALKYTGLLIDIISAVAITTPAFMTFTQKGFDGVNTIAKLVSGSTFSDIHPAAKAAIGLIPGTASGIFYANAGMDFRGNMTETFKYLYNNPCSIPGAMGLFAINAFASFSMSSIAQNIIDKPGNIFALSNGDYGTAYLGTQTAGGLMVNLNSCVMKAYLTQPEPAASNVTVAHIAKRTAGESHPIKPETAQALRQFNLFAPKVGGYTPVQTHNMSGDFVLEM